MTPSMLSNKCIYALKAVFELAFRDTSEPVKTREIAAAQRIPQRFLEIILSELRHAGLLRSKRGNDGGYVLAESARHVTIGEVVECIQGRDSWAAGRRAAADPGDDGVFAEVWEEVNHAIVNVYHSTTFADLVERERARDRESVCNYVI